jgi:hypothetical protein
MPTNLANVNFKQVVDSMVVERARGESQSTSGSLQSLCWGSSATGGIVSAYFSGYFVETYGVRQVHLTKILLHDQRYTKKCLVFRTFEFVILLQVEV